MWEKHRKWPYIEKTAEYNFVLPDICKQFKTSGSLKADELNFKKLGTRYDGKGEIYKVEYDFYVSSDGIVFVIVGAGSIFNNIVCGMWLYSKSIDNRAFITVTHQNAVNHDLSGLWKDNLISTGSLKTAYNNHIENIKKDGTYNSVFYHDREFEDFKRLLEYRLELLRNKGLIYYCDNERIFWRYSFKGATKIAINQFIIGLFRMPYSYIKAFFQKHKNTNKTDFGNRPDIRV